MEVDQKWKIIHHYRKMVSRGLLPRPMCQFCQSDIVPAVDQEGDPVLRCLSCSTVKHLGIIDLERIRKECESA